MPIVARRLWREATGIGMRVAHSALAFLVSVALARLLNPTQLGQYFEVLAWVLLLGAVVQTGWAPFLVREVSSLRVQGKSETLNGIAWLSLRLVGAASLAAALLMIALAYVSGTGGSGIELIIVGAIVIPLLSTSSIRQAITRGMGSPLLGQICESLTRPGIQLILLSCWWMGLLGSAAGPTTAMAIFLIAIASSSILAFYLERRSTVEVRHSATRVVPGRSEWLGSLTRNALIGWSTALNLQVGTLVLAYAAPDPEVAAFRIAQQLSILMALGLNAVITLYAPELGRAFARGDLAAMQLLARKGAIISVLAAIPTALVYVFFGPLLLEQLYGAVYASAYLPLMVMALGQLANAGFGLVTVIAVATRSEAVALRVHVIGAATNLLLCLVLVPVLGAVGAALATAISLITWNFLIFRALKRKFGISSFVGWGLRGNQKS